MKNYSCKMGGSLKVSEGKLRGHEKISVPMKISSGPLPGVNNDWSLRMNYVSLFSLLAENQFGIESSSNFDFFVSFLHVLD